ncbi:ROK family protein [Paenibacillus sp. VMFN-D1]|uniref:ROK family protein n=1 Tax=Paenibacillus sp. VMFN-D1 TaxID=2135608 RepID=UPI000E289D7D|nr:ROK family protein [Paenibacillus sp. VMFN-D1]RED32472.1 glucokinase [Paenibacillus sp. VMFN-D1]
MSKFVIGMDLGGTRIKSAVFDADAGWRIAAERMDATEADKGPEHVLNRMKRIVHELMKEAGIGPIDVSCMGMGIPGLLDPREGLSILSPNFPEWEHIHVVNRMREEFAFPVFIDNDVRVNMYGEWRFGAGRGCRNLMLITLGTGLGSGMIYEGKVIYGTSSSAGEIGHMNMYREGRPCRCGSSGCLGRYVSAVGMVRTFAEKLAEGRTSVIQEWTGNDNSQMTAQLISDAYDRQDALAIEVMHETGELLGYGLANAINLLNPEIIIVGGGMAAAGERLLRPVRETVARHALQLSAGVCRIVQAELGDKAGMLGAAVYADGRLKGGNSWSDNGLTG